MDDFRRVHLEELQQEFKVCVEQLLHDTGWFTASKAAQQSGLYSETIHRVLNKEYFLRHDDIDAILQAARTKKVLNHDEYWFWHGKLHKMVVYKDLVGAAYKETRRGNDDELIEADRLTHNQEIYQKLKKDPLIQDATEKLYQWGEHTWSIIGVCWMASQLKLVSDALDISPPSVTDIFKYHITMATDWSEWIEVFGEIDELMEWVKTEVQPGRAVKTHVRSQMWNLFRRIWEFIT